MQTVWVAVGILFAIFFTIVMCVTMAVSVYAVLQMRKMQFAAEESAKAIRELVGDGAITRAAKNLNHLASDLLPEMTVILKAFNKTMIGFTKAMFVQEQEKQHPAEESAFIPYTEQKAAEREVIREAEAQKMALTDEQLAMMRTDNEPL
jgi:EamA domain-containing membrane protein RarD